MSKKILLFFFTCLYTYTSISCTSRKPLIIQQGIEKIGPSGYGFRSPIWSPDGTKIALTSQTVVNSWMSKIYVLDVSTGKVKKIMETDDGSVSAVSWSPDGNWILLASQKGGDWPEGIWKINANEKEPPEFLVTGYEAAWSPDGNRIAVFTHSEKNAYQDVKIEIIDLKTMKEDVAFKGEAINAIGGGIAWSPGGNELIFDYGQLGIGQVDLYLLNIETREVKKITDAGENYNASWGPGGSIIAFMNDPGKEYDASILIADKNNNCHQQLLALEDLRWPSWSPSGKNIAFISWGEVYVLSLDEFPAYNKVCP